MVVATTPTHEFELSIGRETIKKMSITYSQNESVVLEKTEDDISWNGNVASVTLTQEETLKFDPEESVQIQFRVLSYNDAVIPSPTFIVPVGRVLNPEVLE